MIAVAQYQARKVPVFHSRDAGGGLVHVGVTQVAVFRNHQDAHAVAVIEHDGRDRIVRQTDGIAAHLLQPFQAPFDQPVRQRHTHSRMILVIVDTLDFDAFPIEEKSAVGVEANLPHAKRRGDLVNNFAGHAEGAAQPIETRILQRPQAGFGKRKRLRHFGVGSGGKGLNGPLNDDDFSVGVENFT